MSCINTFILVLPCLLSGVTHDSSVHLLQKKVQKEHQIRIYDVSWSTCAMLAEATGSNSNSRKMSWKSRKYPTKLRISERCCLYMDHKTAHLTQKNPAALKFFPNSASTSGQKLHAPMDFFWFRFRAVWYQQTSYRHTTHHLASSIAFT